jgi:Asp-tRNA(Asn)/Glu-tRNA(Gln) amidotransferase A subunit family amidase
VASHNRDEDLLALAAQLEAALRWDTRAPLHQ